MPLYLIHLQALPLHLTTAHLWLRLTRHVGIAMGGPPNKRAQAEKQSNGSSNGSSESRNATQQSAPKSIPRLDGNRDPGMRKPVEYMATNDLKNLSEFLGLEGWYKARGVRIICSLLCIILTMDSDHCSTQAAPASPELQSARQSCRHCSQHVQRHQVSKHCRPPVRCKSSRLGSQFMCWIH